MQFQLPISKVSLDFRQKKRTSSKIQIQNINFTKNPRTHHHARASTPYFSGGHTIDDSMNGDNEEHGALIYRERAVRHRRCNSVGCTNLAQKGGVCMKHGAKRKSCSSDGCTNQAIKGGVCWRHGAKVKQCISDGCSNQAVSGGVKHVVKVQRNLCSSEGCTNQARKGGVCIVHGAHRYPFEGW